MFLRKYGTGTGADVIIPIIKRGVVDFAVSADWTPASGDVKVSKDGGTEANIGTLPVINGTSGWKFVFSDAELQCKSLTVRIVDSATKAIEDQFFIIETYGNASAMFQSDLSAAQLTANVTHFGGTAGTFSSGRPEVNTTHWGGTAVGSVTINCNMTQISGDAVAADNAEAFFDGTGYAGTNNVIPTVTTVTNGVTISGTITTLDALQAALNSAHGAGSWATATGFSTLDAAGVRTAIGLASANLDTQLADIPTVAEFEARSIAAANYATAANQVIIIDGIGYTLAQVQGSVASPQTSTPAYATSFNGSTYTVTHTGVTSTGVRGTATRSKS